MNALNVAEAMHTLGLQAKMASALMAKAPAAIKNKALRALARLLREQTEALQVDNARDLERARAAGLAEPLVDRLKLSPQVLETCAQGCEQLAAMPDIIGEIIGMKQQPSGIRVGQMRVPIGVFGMIFESRPNVTIEAASLSIKSGNACILRGGSEAIDSNKALAQLVQQALEEAGLPRDAAMTQADLAARLNECLALNKPVAERTPEQQRKVQTLVDVLRIPASSIPGHMNWATFHYRDVVQHRTGGASPFGNVGAVYKGSPDDAALNAGVLRYRADPQAVARFAADTDPTGQIPVPVLTVKGVDDPTAFVELDAQFKATMDKAGSGARLVQTFTRHSGHSYLSDPTYPTLMAALLRWVDGGEGAKPTPAGIAQQCPAYEAEFGKGCAFLPAYVPAPLASRVVDRDRP